MRFGRSGQSRMLSKGSEASRCGRRPSIEPLEQRQLLSVSALPAIHKPPSAVAAALVVPISVDVGSVSGTVSDSSGAAIAGAVVVIVPTKPSGPPTGNAILPPVRVLFAKTDSSGKFSLPKVPVGTYTASAYKEGFNNATSAAFSVTKDNNTDVSITLTPIVTGSASGSVVDSDGKGIAGALVVLSVEWLELHFKVDDPGGAAWLGGACTHTRCNGCTASSQYAVERLGVGGAALGQNAARPDQGPA